MAPTRSEPPPSARALVLAWCGGGAFVASLLFFLYRYLFDFGDPPSGGTAATATVVDVLLFGLFAAHHSLLARPSVKLRVSRATTAVLERSVYTWTASLLFLVVCALWQPVPGELYHLTGAAALPGVALQVLGVVLTVRGSARLGVLDLAGVKPVRDARHGTIAARRPLETGGLYAVVRHPVYLAWVLFVFGAPHMTMTRFVFAAISTAYIAVAVPFEERALLEAFGTEYRTYQKRVRWRMLPGLY
jgi:protein-S-isoprenylcysteine O-methyltransferase Ste14